MRLTPVVLLLVLVSGCTRPSGTVSDPDAPPRRRTDGPRSVPFAGGDPSLRGWVKVDDLLWVREEDEDAFRRGLLRCGTAHLPFDEADRIEKTPEDGYVLRTDHAVLRTNVPFCRAATLAKEVERHVERVLDLYGGPLDLRFPADPLRIVVAARRTEFEAALSARMASPPPWGAFYQAVDGTVYACDEPLKSGGLSVVADLRHETTHAVLDLGRPDHGRERMFHRPHFWLWEAAAMWTEGLGDPPNAREGAERFARFRRRAAWGDVTPLDELFALGQDGFLGRHYDQTATLFAWMWDLDDGALRPGLMALLVRVMDGKAEREDFPRLVGRSVDDVEARFKASLGG